MEGKDVRLVWDIVALENTPKGNTFKRPFKRYSPFSQLYSNVACLFFLTLDEFGLRPMNEMLSFKNISCTVSVTECSEDQKGCNKTNCVQLNCTEMPFLDLLLSGNGPDRIMREKGGGIRSRCKAGTRALLLLMCSI